MFFVHLVLPFGGNKKKRLSDFPLFPCFLSPSLPTHKAYLLLCVRRPRPALRIRIRSHTVEVAASDVVEVVDRVSTPAAAASPRQVKEAFDRDYIIGEEVLVRLDSDEFDQRAVVMSQSVGSTAANDRMLVALMPQRGYFATMQCRPMDMRRFGPTHIGLRNARSRVVEFLQAESAESSALVRLQFSISAIIMSAMVDSHTRSVSGAALATSTCSICW